MESISRLTSRSSFRSSACPLSSIAISRSVNAPTRLTGAGAGGPGLARRTRMGCVIIDPSENAGFESAKLQLWLANCIHAGHVSAYPPGRVHRAVPGNQKGQEAIMTQNQISSTEGRLALNVCYGIIGTVGIAILCRDLAWDVASFPGCFTRFLRHR
jgi:hypothetical protein